MKVGAPPQTKPSLADESVASMQPTIENSCTSPVINHYVKRQGADEIENALTFGREVSGLKTPMPFQKLIVRDGKQNNGRAEPLEQTILVVFDSRTPKREAVDVFRNILFHEIGHVVFGALLKEKSLAYRDFLSAAVQSRLKNPTDHAAANFQALKRGYAIREGILTHHEELMADVFRVAFLKSPGTHASRNFANLKTARADAPWKDAHTFFNPTRKYLWNTHLKHCLDQPNELVRIYRATAAACIAEINESYAARGTESDIRPPSASEYASLNKRLIARLRRTLE